MGNPNFLCFFLLALLMSSLERIPEIYVQIWTEKGPKNGRWLIGYSLFAADACASTVVVYWLLYCTLFLPLLCTIVRRLAGHHLCPN